MLNKGKIPVNVLKRSVIREIKSYNPKVLAGASAGVDAAVIGIPDDMYIITGTEAAIVNRPGAVEMAVMTCSNNIAARFGTIQSISLTCFLPNGCEEQLIRDIMREAEKAAEALNVQITGGHTEVTDSVICPVVSVSAVGFAEKDLCPERMKPVPGDDIIITKWIALEGTSVIAVQKENVLKDRFSPAFVRRAQDFREEMSVMRESRVASGCSVSYMHDLSGGGVFAALWEMGEAAGCGMKIDLMDIPVKQESIEICEEFQLNPYELKSGGSLLITSPQGHDIVRRLKESGINASVIGKVTEGNDRVVINGDEKRFLEPSKTDELNKII